MVDQGIREDAPDTKDLDAELVKNLDVSALELIDEVFAHQTSPQPEGSFTLVQYRVRTGTSEWVADRKLGAMVASGLLSVETMILNGRKTRVWQKKNDDL